MVNVQILKRQIDALQHKNMLEVREKFQELYGFDCGNTTVRNLRKRIAYRLQELYYGGVGETDLNILGDIADKDPLSNLKAAAARKITKLRGTKYYRVWKGKKYEVTVADGGQFVYEGEIYKSLSAVARKITGTRWNGKVFFGVKDYGKKG
nr:MAG TPA: Protein of unknown function (DUF2924) [Caudoviricetes sp.]